MLVIQGGLVGRLPASWRPGMVVEGGMIDWIWYLIVCHAFGLPPGATSIAERSPAATSIGQRIPGATNIEVRLGD